MRFKFASPQRHAASLSAVCWLRRKRAFTAADSMRSAQHGDNLDQLPFLKIDIARAAVPEVSCIRRPTVLL